MERPIPFGEQTPSGGAYTCRAVCTSVERVTDGLNTVFAKGESPLHLAQGGNTRVDVLLPSDRIGGRPFAGIER